MNKMPMFDHSVMLAPALVRRESRDDGSIVLRSPQALGAYARCIGEWVERWAVERAGTLAFAERAGAGEWRRLTWLELRVAIGSVAQALLDLDLPAGKPVVILSDNAIDHAVLMLASMHVGRPVCSVSSAYSRSTKDFAKIRGILDLLDPALVYAADGEAYGAAIRACDLRVPLVVSRNDVALKGALKFGDFLGATEGVGVMRAFLATRPDDHAKYLLTSGSTGTPKLAINTHRMLCANQQMIAQVWRFLDVIPPVLLDWLPWSHTFGGNHNLNLVLRNGGTLTIDEGRPAPGLIEHTVRNLRDARPNMLINVPRGFDMLLPFLEADLELARDVLAPLNMVFYAAAALPSVTWKRLEALAAQVRHEPLWLTTSWGSTETSPAVTSAHWQLDAAGCIGIPLPGLELKLVPNGEKREMRVRGVSVFPGYRDAPELTAAAFDDEGFYKIGDAGFLVDPQRPELGVAFDGRVAEDFKLTTGTWVSVGTLRLKLVSEFAPYAQDVVITGHDRDEVGAMVFLSAAGARASSDEVLATLHQAMTALRQSGAGSSQCPGRVILLVEPPSAEAGEITDKGYINQRAVLTRRSADVALLYAAVPHPRVVRL